MLYDFINNEVLPGTQIVADTFWRTLAEIVERLAPRNRDLLEKRNELQAKIDTWHEDNCGVPFDLEEYRTLLSNIGYLMPEQGDVEVTTA